MATLNAEQQQAFIDVLSFLNDPKRKFHRISGGAGTGKSFFISKVADNILKHKNPKVDIRNMAITATTNKAAAVLANVMPHRRTGIATIHSFMNLRVSSNFSTGEQKIIPTNKWVTHDKTFIIIDEASMVNKKLMDYIERGTTDRCKILFFGDKNQLAPVRESISPVYSRPITESLLLKPVRNAEQPALMELCKQAVDTVLTGKFHPIKEVPGVIDFIDGSQLQGLLEREYNREDPNKRLLCYTNQRVIQYNSFIRQIRGYTDSYNIGEIVVNNSSIESMNKNHLYADQIVEIIDKDEVYNESKLISGHDIPMIQLELKDPDSSFIYDVTCFANPEDRAEVLKYFKELKDWRKYFMVKERYPDLRSVAASTTHKAQGSTYDSVIVDLTDIGKSTNKEQTARLLYVALSRPRNRIYIRGQLPERYFK